MNAYEKCLKKRDCYDTDIIYKVAATAAFFLAFRSDAHCINIDISTFLFERNITFSLVVKRMFYL